MLLLLSIAGLLLLRRSCMRQLLPVPTGPTAMKLLLLLQHMPVRRQLLLLRVSCVVWLSRWLRSSAGALPRGTAGLLQGNSAGRLQGSSRVGLLGAAAAAGRCSLRLLRDLAFRQSLSLMALKQA
jgi:hypothetical protein